MLELEFAEYLRSVRFQQESTISSRISNCKRVEKCEGDLDEHFDIDQCRDLLRRLTYTADDQNGNREVNHKIKIKGDIRKGSATLRNAVAHYRKFRLCNLPSPAPLRRVSMPSRTKSTGQWPEWPKPQDDDILRLAKVLTPLIRFLNPDIIRAVTEDNRKYSEQWASTLAVLGIDPDIYLWDGSPCVFPGIRRHETKAEREQFRKRTDFPNSVKVDDNDYPKQLWAFVFTGKRFRKQGPQGYQLAHLADHKEHNNRWRDEFALESDREPPLLFGLYTSAANLAYVPSEFLKPTDFSGTLRELLLHRAYQLYGGVCRLAPPPLVELAGSSTEWRLDNFDWSEPVGTMDNVADFLEFRRDQITQLLSDRAPAG